MLWLSSILGQNEFPPFCPGGRCHYTCCSYLMPFFCNCIDYIFGMFSFIGQLVVKSQTGNRTALAGAEPGMLQLLYVACAGHSMGYYFRQKYIYCWAPLLMDIHFCSPVNISIISSSYINHHQWGAHSVSGKDTQETLAAVEHGHSWEEPSQLYSKQTEGDCQCHHQPERKRDILNKIR